MTLAAAGVFLIITDGTPADLRFSLAAVFWGLASSAFSAAYSIQPAGLVKKAGVMPVLAWGMIFGGLFAWAAASPFSSGIVWSPASAAAFAFIVLFGTVAAFWCFLSGLRLVSPVAAGLLNCVDPLSAYLFSFLFLSDLPGVWQVIGIAFVLANVVILTLGPKRNSELKER